MRREKRDDGWYVFLRDDGTELFRCKPPPGGFTMADLDRFIEHLKRGGYN